MPSDSLSLRSQLIPDRQPSAVSPSNSVSSDASYHTAVEDQSERGILARPSDVQPAMRQGHHPPLRILSDATRTGLEKHLMAEFVLPQSAGKNFRASLASPFKAFWNWITRKNSKTSISDGASSLSAAAKTAGRAPRLAAEVAGQIKHNADANSPAESESGLSTIEITKTAGEFIGAGEHLFGLARNVKELKDWKLDKKSLESLQQTQAFLKDLLGTQPEPSREALEGRRQDFGKSLQTQLDEILKAHDQYLAQLPRHEERFAEAPDRSDLTQTLKNRLALVEYQIYLKSSSLKPKDAMWVSERSANSARYGVGIASVGTSIAKAAGSAGAESVLGSITFASGALNTVAGGFAVHRSYKAYKDAAKAAEAQKSAGQKIKKSLEEKEEKSADLKTLLLENKRRVEKQVRSEKSSEKKSQALQATDYFIRGGLWIGGLVALAVAPPLVCFGLTTAALLLGGVGAGLSLCALYSKFQRDAALANKTSALQTLHTALSDSDTLEMARNNLLEVSTENSAPHFQKSARHALKVLDAINSSDKYESLVGPRFPLTVEESRPGHLLAYTKEQLLEIVNYKLAVRHSRAIAAAFLDEVRLQNSSLNCENLNFLRDQMGWSQEDSQLYLDLMAVDRRQAEDFFCHRNKLPIPKSVNFTESILA